jgi:hypothetical protein
MIYVTEMGSDAMIYVSCVRKTGLGIQKLTGANSRTHSMKMADAFFYVSFQNKESRLKIRA